MTATNLPCQLATNWVMDSGASFWGLIDVLHHSAVVQLKLKTSIFRTNNNRTYVPVRHISEMSPTSLCAISLAFSLE